VSFDLSKCIFYWIKIEQKKSSGKSSHWKTIVTKENIQDFFIETNGEMIIVSPKLNPKNFRSHLVIDKNISSGTFNDASPRFTRVLDSFNIESTGFLGFNKKLRYSEGIMEIGERITVAGIANWKTLKEPIPEYPYSKIMALEDSVNQKLIITDLPETLKKESGRL